MKKIKAKNVNPSRLLLLVFLSAILIGTILLKFPFSTEEDISWLNALFTATSAMTVTGLVVVDTETAFTLFGEIVIVSLIQLGGLGIMSFAVLIFMMLGKKISFKERILVQQALNQTSLGGVISLVKNLFIFSISIEAIAMLLLAIRWVPEMGVSKGLYYSFFHSISAFNNAGFALWSDSLMGYVGDPLVNIVITFLFIVGGLGFTVLADLKVKRKFQKLSLHTKLMLIGTLILNVVSMLFIFFLEFGNPNTLGPLSLGDKLWASYFQAVTPRTAGFNSLDIASLDDSTIHFMLLLMFVGAGSASTGGGIKLTTLVVIILAVISFLRGKDQIMIARRSISETVVFRSLAISTMALMLIFMVIFILNITEDAPFLEIVFEVISAFGTVGLSMGLTGELSEIGKVMIVLVMFIGKLGPLTMAFSLARPVKSKIRYPKEDVLTG
ncbi:trk system potassium uptake protein TrkH [Bacillus mesophilus]|uniref:Ktr system potassium transporter B n=1 Tax=Bacillus mesophilus TaxID=1808955 RepID=A0A6M0QDX6_9BACI|nr:TrkH family potassium uptake protein [Bacillus mesophilus]MBM7660169.1 trk system potassium uptake protein TrkH [Bacillus mesophilus]NEY73820.1 Ktr system potassium transporter B [Bacillus mesophilus]